MSLLKSLFVQKCLRAEVSLRNFVLRALFSPREILYTRASFTATHFR